MAEWPIPRGAQVMRALFVIVIIVVILAQALYLGLFATC